MMKGRHRSSTELLPPSTAASSFTSCYPLHSGQPGLRGLQGGSQQPQLQVWFFQGCTTSPSNRLYPGRKAFVGPVPVSEGCTLQRRVCPVQVSIPVHPSSCGIVSGVQLISTVPQTSPPQSLLDRPNPTARCKNPAVPANPPFAVDHLSESHRCCQWRILKSATLPKHQLC